MVRSWKYLEDPTEWRKLLNGRMTSRKIIKAFKTCCVYLEILEKSETLTNIPNKYRTKEKASHK